MIIMFIMAMAFAIMLLPKKPHSERRRYTYKEFMATEKEKVE